MSERHSIDDTQVEFDGDGVRNLELREFPDHAVVLGVG